MFGREDEYKMALSMTKGVTAQVVRELQKRGIDEESFFSLETPELLHQLGLSGHRLFGREVRDEALFRARRELENMERHNIKYHFLLDDGYPARLAEIHDAPVCLFRLGASVIEADHMVSIVGTRRPTSGGFGFTRSFIHDLASYFPDLVTVSGLAYGIDVTAHEASMDSGIPTIAVMAHGLDRIYPADHRDVAKRILQHGGTLITEYPFGSGAFKQHFLERNRIIAALSDVTVVVESPIRGGSMSTANTAMLYSRDVMAVPGRPGDENSQGCNHLIRTHKAHLLGCAADFVELCGWPIFGRDSSKMKRNLFPEIDGECRLVYDAVRFSNSPIHIDKVMEITGIPMTSLLVLVSEMEFDGIIVRHPGNRFSV